MRLPGIFLLAILMTFTACRKCIQFSIQPESIAFTAKSTAYGTLDAATPIPLDSPLYFILELDEFSTSDPVKNNCDFIGMSQERIENVRIRATEDVIFQDTLPAGVNLTSYFQGNFSSSPTFTNEEPLIVLLRDQRFTENFAIECKLQDRFKAPFDGNFEIILELSNGTSMYAASQEISFM